MCTGNRYDYSRVIHMDSVSSVSIVFPEYGEFKQRPAMLLSWRGAMRIWKGRHGVLRQPRDFP